MEHIDPQLCQFIYQITRCIPAAYIMMEQKTYRAIGQEQQGQILEMAYIVQQYGRLLFNSRAEHKRDSRAVRTRLIYYGFHQSLRTKYPRRADTWDECRVSDFTNRFYIFCFSFPYKSLAKYKFH